MNIYFYTSVLTLEMEKKKSDGWTQKRGEFSQVPGKFKLENSLLRKRQRLGLRYQAQSNKAEKGPGPISGISSSVTLHNSTVIQTGLLFLKLTSESFKCLNFLSSENTRRYCNSLLGFLLFNKLSVSDFFRSPNLRKQVNHFS